MSLDQILWGPAGLETKILDPLPSLPHGYPQGWCSHLELLVLYHVAKFNAGPFLEIGPWLGLSTTAICCGLRDRPAVGRPAFDTIDFGITSVDEWLEAFGTPLAFEFANGEGIRAIHVPGGSNAVLVENLRRNDLLPFVTSLIRGNFLSMSSERKYGFIFCDATHDKREIDLYCPRISELMSANGIIIFDDILDSEMAEYIISYYEVLRYQLLHHRFPHCKQMILQVK
jgi:hypothetical protein